VNAVLSEDLLLQPTTTTIEVAPEQALKALAKYRGPVIIDLDETLYLRNSTEDFIDSARPALLALVLMRLLDAVRPWRWTGGDVSRDVWRVRCVLLFFPWTRAVWARRAVKLAASAANEPLIAALNERAQAAKYDPPIIATQGFEFIVKPLIAALQLPPWTQLIATRHTTSADRVAGKLSLVTARLGQGAVWRSLVLTDSDQDRSLLEACTLPLHTVWPEAHCQPALSRVYLPGQYMSRVKRPGERYITRGILQEDFALWVLASIGFGLAQPVMHVVGLLFLLLSFWAVYECGYVDNDHVAERYEREPKLSREYLEAPVETPRWAPWIWALASGAVGVAMLRGTDLIGAYALCGWMAVLAATYGVFLIYNRLEKSSRVWLYAVLQLARGAAIVVVVPISVIGAAAIAAHVLAKWLPYYMYRLGGKAWLSVSHFTPRMLFFAIFAVLLACAMGPSVLLNWSAAALVAWNLFRARRHLMTTFQESRRARALGSRTFRTSPVVVRTARTAPAADLQAMGATSRPAR
jgi:hypothetical protein